MTLKKENSLEKKNILYIFNDTGFGGAGQSLLDTLAGIKDDVNPVVIIRNDAAVENRFSKFGIRYYKIRFSVDYVKIGSADDSRRIFDIKQSYEAALQLLPVIKRENIQLIHINSSTSYFAAIAALMAKIPFVWHIRELMEEQFGCEFLNDELKRSLYRKADKLIAISDYVKRKYYEKYTIDTARIYNGLTIARFKKQITDSLQFSNSFLAASMITPEKGQWDVIQATELLLARGYSNIKVIIVGNGPVGYVWALKKYIKRKELERNIYILPFCDDLSNLRSQVSYAITSSQNEALGRVTIEAMLAGNLVIGARSGGTEEIIGPDEERGFLYELKNSESLANTMEKVINCKGEAKKLIMQKAQRYAEDTFDARQYCCKMIKIYDEIIETFEPGEYSVFLNTLKEYYESIKNVTLLGDKFISYNKSATVSILSKWQAMKRKGYSFDRYFKQNGVRVIAIYGMGVLGCRLYDELEGSEIEIKYLLDRNPCGMDRIFRFAALDGRVLDVDMIVVTVGSLGKYVIEEIKSYGNANVVGVDEILDSLNEDNNCGQSNRG